MSELRCEQERSGVRCGLPSGHSGQHQNGPLVFPWSDAPVDPRQILLCDAGYGMEEIVKILAALDGGK